MPVSVGPVRLEGRPDDQLSNWLWLVKWFLVIPHLVVLAFLWITFWVLTVFAFFAILVTGRYPRGIFDFNVGVMRWTWRVAFYAYGALGTDRYPPFTLAERPDYPATLRVAYPERLSRGLVLVKWWLLAIPHYLIIGFFLGGSFYAVWWWGDTTLFGGGLITLMVLIGAVVLLFTGRFPRGVMDFVLGMNRWVARVGAYSALMTDQYPPFRLDTGPAEAAEAAPDGPVPDSPASRGSAGRVVTVVLGALAVLVGLGLAGGGGVALWADQTQRDSDDYITTPITQFSTSKQALRFEDVDVRGIPDWMASEIRIRSSSVQPVFAGIGPSYQVSQYLTRVDHSRVRYGYPPMRGQYWMAGLQPPGSQEFWVASVSGSGERELTWAVQKGEWTLVVLNTDAGPGVNVGLSFGAKVPGLTAIGGVLIGAGAVFIIGGALLQYFGLRRRLAL